MTDHLVMVSVMEETDDVKNWWHESDDEKLFAEAEAENGKKITDSFNMFTIDDYDTLVGKILVGNTMLYMVRLYE